MKKIKLLKTLLIPALGISTMGIVATIATSCGEQPKPSTHSVSGGSLILNGVYGTAGSDENEWKLTKEGQEVTEGVNWSIDTPIAGVSINNGKVSWTNTIKSGTYKFKVVATYEGLATASNTITLTIDGVYQLVGESKKIAIETTDTSRDEGNEWHLKKDGKVVTKGVTWKLVATVGSSVPEWIKLNENNEISWTNAIEGTYSFNIRAKYDGKTFTSSSPFVLNVEREVFEGVKVLANENSTLVLENYGDNNPDLLYSFDRSNWNEYSEQINIQKHQILYLKGRNPEHWSESREKYSSFEITGDVSISGNVMGLLNDGAGTIANIPCDYCFFRLFQNSSGVASVSDNFLPAINLRRECYESMFENCTSLTETPELPATSLEQSCYSNMFEGCSALTEAPELPAMVMVTYCYQAMFRGCLSLTEAPALPSLVLADTCYSAMFEKCTSLTEAPFLPAITLERYCYADMFNGCTSLNSVKIGYTGLPLNAPVQAFKDWVDGVAETGTFYYNGPDYVHASLFNFPGLWVREYY